MSNREEIRLIVKEIGQEVSQQIAQQVAQEVAQQQAKQIEQAIAQGIQDVKQAVQGSSQEKISFAENKAEEINAGEAHRSAVLSATRSWNHNDKSLVEKSQDYDRSLKSLELKERALEVAEREAKIRKQASLDAIEVSEREQSALLKHLANTLLIDFRTASYHPISPNDGDENRRGEEGKVSRK